MGIEERLEGLRQRIAEAASRSGRSGEEITLVAVTKTVPVERIREAIALGVSIIGENRVGEARAKYDEIGAVVQWHMVGHLQRRKVREAVAFFDLIHSIDRLSIAEETNKRCQAAGRTVDVLIEVNVSGESSKYGVAPSEAAALVEQISRLPSVSVRGLMTMAPFTDDSEEVRPCFQRLRRLSDDIRKEGLPGVEMRYLSMGMTNDFEVAIEEGANMIRVGTAIFGTRKG